MALARFLSSTTQGYALIERYVVPNNCGLADDYPHAMVDEQALTNHSAGMDFNARKETGELRNTAREQFHAMRMQLLGRGFAWLDTGTMESLVEAADFVHMIEKRQGIKISAPEEIAFKYGWIDRDTLLESAERYGKSPYGQHLKNVADGKLRY